MSKIAEHRATVLHVQKQFESLKVNMTEEGMATRARLDAIFSDINAMQASVTDLRTLGEQIPGYIRTFRVNVRDALQTPMQCNWQIYQIFFTDPTSHLSGTDILAYIKHSLYERFRRVQGTSVRILLLLEGMKASHEGNLWVDILIRSFLAV